MSRRRRRPPDAEADVALVGQEEREERLAIVAHCSSTLGLLVLLLGRGEPVRHRARDPGARGARVGIEPDEDLRGVIAIVPFEDVALDAFKEELRVRLV